VTTILSDLKRFFLGSRLNVLILLLPVAFVLEHQHAAPIWVFVTAGLSIIPLAALIGHGTEVAASHTGPGLGGLLNATFGNATELIIALLAARAGLYGVVKASITGSILGNMLLVLGLAMLAGGRGRETQTFNRTAAGASVSMLMLAVTALVMPALWELVVFHEVGRPSQRVQLLSLLTSGVLLATYLASLVFSLVTHRELFTSVGREEAVEGHRTSLASGISLLVVSTVLTAVASEVLVGAIEPAAKSLGWTELFVGVIIVAVVGNAAEHFTAVVVAAKGDMDLAFHIAIGSSTQIALLVAPILVFTSLLFARPMDLLFHPFEIVALGLSVLTVSIVCQDGESNWFEGLQLIALYLVLGIAFYFVPAHAK
jgi:Ca2+:H+ antiporter